MSFITWLCELHQVYSITDVLVVEYKNFEIVIMWKCIFKALTWTCIGIQNCICDVYISDAHLCGRMYSASLLQRRGMKFYCVL